MAVQMNGQTSHGGTYGSPGQTPLPKSPTISKKTILFIIVIVQLAMMLAIQWRYGNVLYFLRLSSPREVSAISAAHAPINFLGGHIDPTVESHDEHVDVHYEHPTLGHTWEEREQVEAKINPKNIAIGLAITSSKLHGVKPLNQWPFFSQLMASFCKTCSGGFNYHFFLAYDFNDKYFTDKTLHSQFAKNFKDFSKANCRGESNYTLHFVQCSHTGKPANAQNDAMMAAYMLNMGYFYRINDDTIMKTNDWTEQFIEQLHKFDPADIGVVGPNHKGGNLAILTYDFVSNHHVNIFGCYYPHVFTDWWGDSWISTVYLPGRVSKLKSVDLVHTLSAGQRYKTHWDVKNHLKDEVNYGKMLVQRYVIAMQKKIEKFSDHVIAMSLYGNDPTHTYGAIRNAQLMPILFPNWTLVIYIDAESNPAPPLSHPPKLYPNATEHVLSNMSLKINQSKPVLTGSSNSSTSQIVLPKADSKYTVPWLVLNKLRTLGAKIVAVDSKGSAPSVWPYVALDDQSSKFILVRRADSRITVRDEMLVAGWLKTQSSLLYTREMEYSDKLPTGGNIGIKTAYVNKEISVSGFIEKHREKATEWSFLSLLEKATTTEHTCFDSLHCQENGCKPFPLKAERKGEFFGQRYDIYDTPALPVPVPTDKCVNVTAAIV